MGTNFSIGVPEGVRGGLASAVGAGNDDGVNEVPAPMCGKECTAAGIGVYQREHDSELGRQAEARVRSRVERLLRVFRRRFGSVRGAWLP